MKKTYMQSADALGSTIEIRLVTSESLLAEKWFIKLWSEITKFEKEFSRFKKDSELSKFNDRAGERVLISETFKLILNKAKEFSSITNGVFNPFILPYLQQSGYIHSMTGTKSGPDYRMRDSVDWHLLEIGKEWARIPPNTAIDLGGIGKGFLADHLARVVEDHIPDYCLSLGGDIRLGGTDAEGPWKIDIASPEKNLESQFFFISKRQTWGIATSGAMREKSNLKQNHLIDPKTGVPIASGAICTVVAESTTAADVLASCILISGKNMAIDLFKKAIIDGALIQDKDGINLLLGTGFSTIKDEVELSNNVLIYA